ncbi:MAG: hypothetical protein DRI52_10670, partial [Chloroflexi bacterium]
VRGGSTIHHDTDISYQFASANLAFITHAFDDDCSAICSQSNLLSALEIPVYLRISEQDLISNPFRMTGYVYCSQAMGLFVLVYFYALGWIYFPDVWQCGWFTRRAGTRTITKQSLL